MITLGVETSAIFCSAALVRDGALLGEQWLRGAHAHSAALLPMIDQLLQSCSLDISDVGRFAVTAGPGSFTGVRIGVATVKGLAAGPPDRLCAGVSTLEAMAALGRPAALENHSILCCAMDARRAQVYAALFDESGRLTPDRALPIAELEQQLAAQNRPALFFGDGAALCFAAMQKRPDWQQAPEAVRFQRAQGAILAAREEDFRSPALLLATYLRR